MNLSLLILFLLCLITCKAQQNKYQPAPPHDETETVSASTKSAISTILSIFFVMILLGAASIYICYRNTNRIEKQTDKFRQKLAETYLNGVRSNSPDVTPVNEFLLRVIVPDRPIQSISLLKSFRYQNTDRERPTLQTTESDTMVFSHFRPKRKGKEINFGDQVRKDLTIMVPIPSQTKIWKSQVFNLRFILIFHRELKAWEFPFEN